jgi:hypothetical protein
MSTCVQLDLFDRIAPIATFDWANDKDLKIFDYSDDLKFDDIALENNYVINVPCYRIEDVIKIFYPDFNDEQSHIKYYFEIVKNKKLNDCVVRMTDYDSKGWGAGDKWFLLANSKTQKYIRSKGHFAMLQGNIKKMPKLYKKVVEVKNIHYRQDMKRNWVEVYTLGKWFKDHVLEQINS